MVRLGGTYLAGVPHLEGLRDCFDNLGTDSIFLGHSSCEGSRNVWGSILAVEVFVSDFGGDMWSVLVWITLSGGVGRMVWEFGQGFPFFWL